MHASRYTVEKIRLGGQYLGGQHLGGQHLEALVLRRKLLGWKSLEGISCCSSVHLEEMQIGENYLGEFV